MQGIADLLAILCMRQRNSNGLCEMRIGIYHNLPSGGAKRALLEMIRRLVDSHEVDVYTLSSAEHRFCDLRPFLVARDSKHIVVPFEPLPLLTRPLGRLSQGIRALDLLRLCALQRYIARQIDSEGYDVVFVHHCQYGQAPSLLQFLATPSVYYCQEPPRAIYEPPLPRPYSQLSSGQRLVSRFDPLPVLYRRLLAKLDRASARAASLLLVNSAYSRESLYRTYGLFAQVCLLGVDTHQFRPQSNSNQAPGEAPAFVLSVGAIRPNKGFSFLVHSLSLIDAVQRLPLVIVSNYADYREQGYLEELAGELGVLITFRTLISDEELVQLYNQAWLTLYAPIMEPFGFVPIESMACGTPVVGVREGGVRETVLDGQTGLLTEREPHSFAAAVLSLTNDTERRAQYGFQGRRDVEERWQWARTVRDLEVHLASAGNSRSYESWGEG